MSYDNYKLLHTNISIIEVAASQLVEACGTHSSRNQAENVGKHTHVFTHVFRLVSENC